jgi:hypothetical protein
MDRKHTGLAFDVSDHPGAKVSKFPSFIAQNYKPFSARALAIGYAI